MLVQANRSDMDRISCLSRLSVEHLNSHRFAAKGPECKGCLIRRELNPVTGEHFYMIYYAILRAHHLFLFRNERANSCDGVKDLRLPIREFKPDSDWPHCGDGFELGAGAGASASGQPSASPADDVSCWTVGIPLSGGGRWQSPFSSYAKSAVCGLELPPGEDEYEDGEGADGGSELDGLLAELAEKQPPNTDSPPASDSGSISSSGKPRPPPPPRRSSVLSSGTPAAPSTCSTQSQAHLCVPEPPAKEKPRPPSRSSNLMPTENTKPPLVLPKPATAANQPPVPPKAPVPPKQQRPAAPANQPPLPSKIGTFVERDIPQLPLKLPLTANQPPLPPKLPLTANQPPVPPKLPLTANQPPLPPKLPLTADQPPLPPKTSSVVEPDVPQQPLKLPLMANQPPVPPKLPLTANQPPVPPKLPLTANQPPLPPKTSSVVEPDAPLLPPKLPSTENQPPLPPKTSSVVEPDAPLLPPKQYLSVNVPPLPPKLSSDPTEPEALPLPPRQPVEREVFQPNLFGLLHFPGAAPPDAICGYYRRGYYSGNDVKDAKRLMRKASGNGVYMLRGFCQGQQDQELAVCLRLDEKSYKFRVEMTSTPSGCQQFCIAGEKNRGEHASMEALLFHYHLFPILTGIDVTDMRLARPFDLEPDAVITGLTAVFSACLWQYGGKATCTDVLVEAGDGTYALRLDSDNATVVCLCVVQQSQVLKFRIVVSGSGQKKTFAINFPSSTQFDSIEDLLLHYHKNPLPTNTQCAPQIMLKIPFQLSAKCQQELSRHVKLPDELAVRSGTADALAAKLSKAGSAKGGGNFFLHVTKERKGGGGILLAIEEGGGTEVQRLRIVAMDTGLIGQLQRIYYLEDKPEVAALSMDRLVQILCVNPSCLTQGFPRLTVRL